VSLGEKHDAFDPSLPRVMLVHPESDHPNKLAERIQRLRKETQQMRELVHSSIERLRNTIACCDLMKNGISHDGD
jgi:hypothetical protein